MQSWPLKKTKYVKQTKKKDKNKQEKMKELDSEEWV